MGAIDYAMAGPLTGLERVPPEVLRGVPSEVLPICKLAAGLVMHPMFTGDLVLTEGRLAEQQLRTAEDIIQAVLALDPASLQTAREPVNRTIGTCRNFVVLNVALLRYRGTAARARCGFGTYFDPGRGLDHWITEYWHSSEGRWVRVDTQHLDGSFVAHPEDLRPGEFLTGGEAWARHQDGVIDAAMFGVPGTDNWGPAEIRGNAVRDLAALNKVETLPWDEWGRMTASYAGQTGPDYDNLIDEIASACATDEPSDISELYARPELTVPAELIR
ncbi:MAG TPA: transglutaminase domain-containing protein [Streptosporangiaceae bacterium]|nr:transglutaminase domain-containing protein [Streptosporangiaceae bacterium]